MFCLRLLQINLFSIKNSRKSRFCRHNLDDVELKQDNLDDSVGSRLC